MRLYAKVTSERASKGQGGNEFLRAVVTAEIGDNVRDDILILYVEPCAKGYDIRLSSRHGDELYSEVYEVERPKGECPEGGNHFTTREGDEEICRKCLKTI